MKRIFSNTALSLLELIIATVLVVVIILGIFAISSVLRSNNEDYGQKYSVKSATQITLDHILNNASLAIGSGTTDSNGNLDLGILTNVSGDPNTFCIHQAANNNLINSSSDIWLCYTLFTSASGYVSGSGPNQIYYCTMLYDPTSNTSNRGAVPCNAVYCNINKTWNGVCSGPVYLGSAYSITNSPAGSALSSPSFSNNGNQMLFSITIQNCLDDSNTTPGCNSLGVSTNAANNPEVQLTGSTYPLQEGMLQY